jgi:putative transposase
VLAQSKRNKHAAPKLMRKLLKKCAFTPERLVTDDLRSYAPAARDIGIEHLHERGRWKNNRAENSHQPTRRRERKMQGDVHNNFNLQRHLASRNTLRSLREEAFRTWQAATAV